MWYTPLGSRPASAECSRTYQKLVQGERKEQVVNEWQGCLLAFLALLGVQRMRYPKWGIILISVKRAEISWIPTLVI